MVEFTPNVILDEAAIRIQIEGIVRTGAEAAKALWEAHPREQSTPGYPFEKTVNPRPGLDVVSTPEGFTLTLTGPQVSFWEFGNGPNLIRPKTKPKMIIQAADGGAPFQFAFVQPYEGKHVWLESCREIFGPGVQYAHG